MQGHPDVIATLNKLLAEELTAINQYMVHSEMCDAWGYQRLHKIIEKVAIDEMKHAEKLIGRILFLEGRPIVSQLNPLHIGEDVEQIVVGDLQSEVEAIGSYNAAIAQAAELKDNGTRDLLQAILEDEEKHVDLHESHRDQIKHMGLAGFLTDKMRE